jgi:hypothetical protein
MEVHLETIVLALALALSAPAAFAADSTSARRYGSSEALSVRTPDWARS